MNNEVAPWHFNQDLTSERLQLVSQFIADIRHQALEDFDESKGDDRWGYGCRCYERCRNKIFEKSLLGDWDWLKAEVGNTLECKFKIGHTSMRFYKGPSNKIPERTLAQAYDEIKQLSFDFEDDSDQKLIWRLAIETGVEGNVTAITCVGANLSGAIICSWPIPLNPYIPTLTTLHPNYDDAVEQPAPRVTLAVHEAIRDSADES